MASRNASFHEHGVAGVLLAPLKGLCVGVMILCGLLLAAWMAEKPWYLEARLSPIGFGWSKDGNPLTVAALASGGLDARWFSVGLGAGLSMLNGDDDTTKFQREMTFIMWIVAALLAAIGVRP